MNRQSFAQAGVADPARMPTANGLAQLGISDEDVVQSVQPQLRLQRERGTDISLFSPRAAAKDVDFYTGKIAAAKWFAQNRLPLLAGERLAAETTNLEIMELSEDAF